MVAWPICDACLDIRTQANSPRGHKSLRYTFSKMSHVSIVSLLGNCSDFDFTVEIKDISNLRDLCWYARSVGRLPSQRIFAAL
jgi:hypothetical protein